MSVPNMNTTLNPIGLAWLLAGFLIARSPHSRLPVTPSMNNSTGTWVLSHK